MSRALTRSRMSTASMGSKKEHSASESDSVYRYFSIMTRFRGHGFSVLIYRRAPESKLE